MYRSIIELLADLIAQLKHGSSSPLYMMLFLSGVTWEGLAAPKPARLHTRFEPRSRVGGCM